MKKKHTIDTLFVLLLYSMFAVLSLLLVLIGTQVYKRIVDESEYRSNTRASIAYVSNKIRANDVKDAISIEKKQDIDVLVITEKQPDYELETLIYFYDGAIRELNTIPEDEFVPRFGEALAHTKDFSIKYENGLYTVVTTDLENKQHLTYISSRVSD